MPPTHDLLPPLQYPEADILTSSDHLSNTVDDEGLERWPQAASAANIGIMLFRPRANALAKVRPGAGLQRCQGRGTVHPLPASQLAPGGSLRARVLLWGLPC